MRLSQDATIAPEKVSQYLLVRQNRGDKSAFLERAGFTSANPLALTVAIQTIRDGSDASMVDENKFGRYYEVVGTIVGPNGASLRVKTIWMTEHLSGATKFITLIPIEFLSQ